ncbi:hypothetical protein NLG97_g7526 [Lecanicillium saksenae]|uniref:Uncharacterized protein n=1 Tax=Lecanicillium saksenae TaxID=468837 RepID=A0ACC1QQE5_9HYPO|nr:hypothetical protein NLG97_g7526 [Lecanicillium saksenae]
MVSFSQGFADGDAVDSIETETTRVVVHELEPGWWILVSIDLNKIPLPPRLLTKNSKPQEEKYDYNTKEMKPAALVLRDLQRAYRIFLMHHDVSLSSLFLRLPRHKFVAVLSRYWDLFLSTWSVSLHGNPTRDIYQGINVAASGELGVGVGEEERGSGEREVLEGLVGRTEGLVDLVVSTFGSDGEDGSDEKGKATHVAFPWLGSGREPSIDDGAIFLGTGALSRKSLRDVTHWMEDLYTWGEHAYGVIESPISTRKSRPKKSNHQRTASKPPEPASRHTEPATPPKMAAKEAAAKDGEPAKKDVPQPVSDPQASTTAEMDTAKKPSDEGKDSNITEPQTTEAEDGRLDKMVSYLKLGYGQYWSIPSVPGLSGSTSEQTPDTAKRQPSSKTGDIKSPKRPAMPKSSPSQDAAGHYLIGLKGEIEEAYGGDDDGAAASDDSETEHDSRTVLRAIHVELEANNAGGFDNNRSQQESLDAGGATLTEVQMRGTLRPGANTQEHTKSEKLRVVVYVNRPFIFVFLFRLRTDSLAWDSLYRSLHYQLSPLRKPLLASVQYRPERPDTGRSGAAGIYDLVWNPVDLTVHTTVPNIPDHPYARDAVARVTDLERTQRRAAGGGWCGPRLVAQRGRVESHDAPQARLQHDEVLGAVVEAVEEDDVRLGRLPVGTHAAVQELLGTDCLEPDLGGRVSQS